MAMSHSEYGSMSKEVEDKKKKKKKKETGYGPEAMKRRLKKNSGGY